MDITSDTRRDKGNYIEDVYADGILQEFYNVVEHTGDYRIDRYCKDPKWGYHYLPEGYVEIKSRPRQPGNKDGYEPFVLGYVHAYLKEHSFDKDVYPVAQLKLCEFGEKEDVYWWFLDLRGGNNKDDWMVDSRMSGWNGREMPYYYRTVHFSRILVESENNPYPVKARYT